LFYRHALNPGKCIISIQSLDIVKAMKALLISAQAAPASTSLGAQQHRRLHRLDLHL
jgi:hypothetical protein